MAAHGKRGCGGDVPALCLLAAGLAGAFLFSLLLGRYAVSPATALRVLLSAVAPLKTVWSTDVGIIILSVRLPRIAADILVGAALSTSGAAFQGIFRNPLVSPDILGVSAGAGLGAALGILLELPPAAIQASAFALGMAAVMAAYGLGSWRSGEGDGVLILVLSGVIIGTVFSACISLVKYVADPYNSLPAITFWLLGSLAAVSAGDVALVAGPILIGVALMNLLRWNLNVLSFGDEEARAMGVNVRRMRLLIIAGATVMTSSAVAISGVVGLVGLVCPHLARLLVGPNYRLLMPASTIIGALFLLVVDDVARTLFPAEIPLGILTSLIGAPFFVYLLSNLRKGWGE